MRIGFINSREVFCILEENDWKKKEKRVKRKRFKENKKFGRFDEKFKRIELTKQTQTTSDSNSDLCVTQSETSSTGSQSLETQKLNVRFFKNN